MFDSIWLVFTFLVLGSPALLWWARSPTFDGQSFRFALAAGGIAAVLPLLGFGDQLLVWQILFAQTAMFVIYVSVSRTRQRQSPFLNAVLGIFSNGGWFLSMFVLANAYTHAQKTLHGTALSMQFIGFLAAMIGGILGGRLVGVQWMLWVEKKYAVRTDSVGSPGLVRLDRYTNSTLTYGLVISVAVILLLGLAPVRDVLIVVGIGLIQKIVYAINSRLVNRNHPGWPMVTGLLTSVVFIIQYAYLLGYSAAGGTMPLALLVPYTVATVAGGNIGVLFSMIFEKWLGLNSPDAHVKEGMNPFADVVWHRYFLAVAILICGIYLFASEPILAAIGVTAHDIVLPFWFFDGTSYARPAALLLGVVFFFSHEVTQTLSSRAGNRNHASYHAVTCLIFGVGTFWMGAFAILNAHFLDLIPVAAMSSVVGQLLAQKFSIWMEKRLVSVMDVD